MIKTKMEMKPAEKRKQFHIPNKNDKKQLAEKARSYIIGWNKVKYKLGAGS